MNKNNRKMKKLILLMMVVFVMSCTTTNNKQDTDMRAYRVTIKNISLNFGANGYSFTTMMCDSFLQENEKEAYVWIDGKKKHLISDGSIDFCSTNY